MTPAKGSRSRKALSNRLIRWFLLLTLLPLGVIAVTSSVLFRIAVEREARTDLAHTADVKAEAIEGYCADLMEDMTTIAHAPGVIDAFQPGAAGNDRAVAKLRAFLAFSADASAFSDLILLTPAGDVVFTARGMIPTGQNIRTGLFAGTELSKLVERVQTLVQADASNFQVYSSSTEPMAFVAAPVLADGAVVGVLVCRLNNTRLFRTLSDYGGLGTTGETLVAGEIGGRIVLVAPTRYDHAAAFHRAVQPESDGDTALRAALAGSGGSGQGTDYRGEPVIGAWRYLPTFGWGMVVKQDQAEAFAAVRTSRFIGLSLAAVLIPFVIVAAWAVARSITGPLRTAASTANAVAGGDLTVRMSGPIPDDETGAVAESLAIMTTNLAELVGRIKHLGHSLENMSAKLTVSGQQQESTATAFNGAAAEIASAVCEIAATGQELLVTTNEAGIAATENAEVADASRAGLVSLTRAMRQLAEGAAEIGHRLAAIDDEARRVAAVVVTIAEIADQANLLSVNAAIEAEKAGESGRGFRVVAREIRRLADRTTASTMDVKQIVGQMGAVVAIGVGEMTRYSEEVRTGIAAADGIAADLVQIIAAANAAEERFSRVRDGIQAQTEGTRQIDLAMKGLTQNARVAAAGASELKAAAEQLRASITELGDQIAGFRIT